MQKTAVQRIQAELKDFLESSQDVTSEEFPVKIELVDESWTHLKGTIAGPPGTPYKGGTFELEIIVPEMYPLHAPKVRFLTKVWHPNVSHGSGDVCVDILKNKWHSSMTIRSILLTMQQFLAWPNTEDPLDLKPSRQLRKFPNIFILTAQQWTGMYAGGPKRFPELEDCITKLEERGFNRDFAVSVLSSFNWDVTRAINALTN